jgi:hypothetical protein
LETLKAGAARIDLEGNPDAGRGSSPRSDPGSMAGPISRSLSIVVQAPSETASTPDVRTQGMARKSVLKATFEPPYTYVRPQSPSRPAAVNSMALPMLPRAWPPHRPKIAS